MDELSLNILDIAYNSLRAHASLISISIIDSQKDNILKMIIEDNGDGMSQETLNKVIDPFYTTRTTRTVGLGIPLLKQNAELTGGYLHIDSQLNVGTKLEAVFIKNHIDTPILGDLEETMMTLIQADENVDYQLTYTNDLKSFQLDTREIKDILKDVSIVEPEVLIWLKDYMKEGLAL